MMPHSFFVITMHFISKPTTAASSTMYQICITTWKLACRCMQSTPWLQVKLQSRHDELFCRTGNCVLTFQVIPWRSNGSLGINRFRTTTVHSVNVVYGLHYTTRIIHTISNLLSCPTVDSVCFHLYFSLLLDWCWGDHTFVLTPRAHPWWIRVNGPYASVMNVYFNHNTTIHIHIHI